LTGKRLLLAQERIQYMILVDFNGLDIKDVDNMRKWYSTAR